MKKLFYLLDQNKMSIYIETGSVLFDNVDSGESIYDFFAVQQNSSKNLLEFEFIFSVDNESYVSQYLIVMSITNGNKYDMLTNRFFNFFFFFTISMAI